MVFPPNDLRGSRLLPLPQYRRHVLTAFEVNFCRSGAGRACAAWPASCWANWPRSKPCGDTLCWLAPKGKKVVEVPDWAEYITTFLLKLSSFFDKLVFSLVKFFAF